jgi:hypothetical protein
MGGGHSLIESLGSVGGTITPSIESVFGLSMVWTLLVILLLKLFITAINVGSGIPCGIFIPVIAIGACVGALLNNLWLAIDPNFAPYCDLLIMLCMASFFTAVVRAPITSIIMICEFTGSFAPLLPVVIAVSCGYFIGDISQTEGIYEELLERYVQESGIHERAVTEGYTLTLTDGAIADRREVKDVLWPAGAKVAQITRGEERILPDGKTLLRGGDVLTIEVKSDEPEMVKDELSHILD